MKNVRFIGLDVHAETIAVAVAEQTGEVRSLGVIPNRSESVRRLVGKLGKPEQLRVCYEAGPTGYALYWQLSELGVHCDVVAPTLVPVKAGDRVKTDRRDAEKLARCYRGGDLTAVWVPDQAHEALRDLVRARLAAKRDQVRAQHRLGKFLLRQGRRAPDGVRAWTGKYMAWIKQQRFEQPAQEVTLLDYLHEVEHAVERMGRLEQSIDTAVEAMPQSQRAVGSISKAGNAHLRRLVVEAAWGYRHRPNVGPTLRARQSGQSESVKSIAWRAQHRLYERYRALLGRGKSKQKVITAVARELLGFIWAIGWEIEHQQERPPQRRAA